MMKDYTIEKLLDLKETIAAELFEEKSIPGKCFRKSEILL